MRNKHVRMSIHFGRDEVSLECCPKCGLKQVCELDKETTCKAKACGFSYRGHIKDAPIVELNDDDDDGVGVEERPGRNTNMGQRADPRKRLLKNEQENSAWFSRISVSQQPEEIAIRRNSKEDFDSDHSDVLANNPTPQPADANMSGWSLPQNSMNEQDSHRAVSRRLSTEALDGGELKRHSINFSSYYDAKRALGIFPPAPNASGDGAQKAYETLRDSMHRRWDNNSNFTESVSSNEQNTPSAGDPSAVFQDWFTPFGLQSSLHSDGGQGQNISLRPDKTYRAHGNSTSPSYDYNNGFSHQNKWYGNVDTSNSGGTALNSGYRVTGGASDYYRSYPIHPTGDFTPLMHAAATRSPSPHTPVQYSSQYPPTTRQQPPSYEQPPQRLEEQLVYSFVPIPAPGVTADPLHHHTQIGNPVPPARFRRFPRATSQLGRAP